MRRFLVVLFLSLVIGHLSSNLVSAQSPTPYPQRSFYISPTGNDTNTGLSTAIPIATFDHAWALLYPGDTLYLMDGTYYQSLTPNVRDGVPNPTINSQDYRTYPLDHPERLKYYIKIKALTDGQAVIDGQYQRPPISLGYYTQGGIGNYYLLEGLVAKNSSGQVYLIGGRNLVIRRCSGYNANTRENNHVFTVSSGGSPQDPANILLEDNIAGGSGRKMFMAYGTYVNVIFRRLFAAWQEWTSDPGASYHPGEWPWGDGIEIYNWQQPDLSAFPELQNSIVENSITYGMLPTYGFSLSPNPARTQFNNFLGDIAIGSGQKWNRTTSMVWPLCADPDGIDADGKQIRPWTTWSNGDPGPKCINWIGWYPHRAGFDFGVYSKPFYRNNTFRDLFAYGNAMAGLEAGENGASWCNGSEGAGVYPCAKCNRTESSRSDNCAACVYDNPASCPESAFTPSERSSGNVLDHISLANNGIGTPVSNHGAGVEISDNSLAPFTQFGSPSNLYIEGKTGYTDKSVGARLRYRYVNGVLTTQELWPWPMEDRIRQEFSQVNGPMSAYHSINPELQNFSVTNTIVPLINAHTAVQVPVSILSGTPAPPPPTPVYSYPDLWSRIAAFGQTDSNLNFLGTPLIDIFDYNYLVNQL